jgi:hypothetical protein
MPHPQDGFTAAPSVQLTALGPSRVQVIALGPVDPDTYVSVLATTFGVPAAVLAIGEALFLAAKGFRKTSN